MSSIWTQLTSSQSLYSNVSLHDSVHPDIVNPGLSSTGRLFNNPCPEQIFHAKAASDTSGEYQSSHFQIPLARERPFVPNDTLPQMDAESSNEMVRGVVDGAKNGGVGGFLAAVAIGAVGIGVFVASRGKVTVVPTGSGAMVKVRFTI